MYNICKIINLKFDTKQILFQLDKCDFVKCSHISLRQHYNNYLIDKALPNITKSYIGRFWYGLLRLLTLVGSFPFRFQEFF